MRVLRVLGIDPSLLRTGYGVVETDGATLRLVEGGLIKSPPSAPLAERLSALQRGLAEVIEALHPDVMAIEELFARTAYPKTAILMAHARGALVCAASLARLPVINYTATSVKRALVGRGGATKDQVALMVAQTLRLRRRPSSVDVTDALALAIAHLQRNGSHGRGQLRGPHQRGRNR